ncbi:hypothetical protein ACF0H5_006406 [Mactra antiquata]
MSWILIHLLLGYYNTGAVLGENGRDVTLHYDMAELCGRSIDLEKEGTLAVEVYFHGEYQYISDNCSINFQSGYWNENGWDSISLHFKKFYIRDDSCLVIYTFTNWSTELLGRFCRYENLTNIGFNTTNNGIFSIMYEHNDHNRNYGYDTVVEFVVTVFKENGGNCSELLCHNNRCIPYDLMCLGYNPCGDWSDCLIDDVIAAAIFALTFLTITMVVTCFIIKCCCCKPSKRNEGVVLSIHHVTSRNNRETRNGMNTAESMEVFPDMWNDYSFNEAIVLEPLHGPNNQSTVQSTQRYEKHILREQCQPNLLPLATNNFDAGCSAHAHETCCSGRAETPPPSYDEVITQEHHFGISNHRHTDNS